MKTSVKSNLLEFRDEIFQDYYSGTRSILEQDLSVAFVPKQTDLLGGMAQ
jgi:hypothetical protein